MRLVLHALQRLGSFLNCLSWKNICSPAVKTNSASQSMHFNILSWNSIEDAPFSPFPERSPDEIVAHERAGFCNIPLNNCETPWIRPAMPGARAWIYNLVTAGQLQSNSPSVWDGDDKRMGHHRGMEAQLY
jgi:hypothetical protein